MRKKRVIAGLIAAGILFNLSACALGGNGRKSQEEIGKKTETKTQEKGEEAEDAKNTALPQGSLEEGKLQLEEALEPIPLSAGRMKTGTGSMAAILPY